MKGASWGSGRRVQLQLSDKDRREAAAAAATMDEPYEEDAVFIPHTRTAPATAARTATMAAESTRATVAAALPPGLAVSAPGLFLHLQPPLAVKSKPVPTACAQRGYTEFECEESALIPESRPDEAIPF
jgi:hypothetical protein